jgi:hypothetical protein|tara:strand:+ start:34 stop:474 length:441 start_codon:yes stop_codon:yes gene_type:complete
MSRLIFLAVIAFLNLSCTEKKIKIQAYMSPTCGCCKKWVSHLEDNGFEVESVFRDNMRVIKSKYNISQEHISCHTGVIGSYFVEGHVPAEDIKRLISENPDIAGITVPGMPAGLNVPGMETINKNAEYDVLYVRKDGSSDVWKHYN